MKVECVRGPHDGDYVEHDLSKEEHIFDLASEYVHPGPKGFTSGRGFHEYVCANLNRRRRAKYRLVRCKRRRAWFLVFEEETIG